jgi:hypothetical protein
MILPLKVSTLVLENYIITSQEFYVILSQKAANV